MRSDPEGAHLRRHHRAAAAIVAGAVAAILAAIGVSPSAVPLPDAPSTVTAAKSKVAFKACVLKVGSPPQAFSGRAIALQTVKYEIVSGISRNTIAIRHLIVDGKKDVRDQVPALKRRFVRADAGVRVTAFLTDPPVGAPIYVAAAPVVKKPGLDCG